LASCPLHRGVVQWGHLSSTRFLVPVANDLPKRFHMRPTDDTPPSVVSPPTRPPESSTGNQIPGALDTRPPEPAPLVEGEWPVTLTPELGDCVQTMAATDPTRGGPGRYVLSAEIGRGGMGRVLRGRDPGLGRDVALKVLLEKHAGN